MERDECIRRAVRPEMAAGDERLHGQYWRNLDSDAVKKRFPDDSDPPEFGYKFHPRPDKWNWGDGVSDGLSVNCASCTSAQCSVALHHQPERFSHAVLIDLGQLSDAIKIEIVAQYDPIEPTLGNNEQANPCHFVLLPARARLEDLKIAVNHLALKAWPKSPRDDSTRRAALEMKSRWEQVFVSICCVTDRTDATR